MLHLALVALAFAGCQTKKSVITADHIRGASYEGTLPCTDCEGINQVVILDSGNTFTLTETYLGEDQKETSRTGRWQMQDGRVILTSNNATIAQYALAGNQLVYLDEASMQARKKIQAVQGMLQRRNFVRSKKIDPNYLDGIDIVGFGTTTAWSLDITHDKAIQFAVPGMDAPVTFSPVAPTINGDSIIYNIVAENDRMRVVLIPGYCSDGVSKNLYDYKVSVQYRGKTFNGCGAVLNADGTLTGTWLFEGMTGTEIKTEHQPFIVVDLAQQKFIGNTGCNDIYGTARLRDSKICFSDINFKGQKDCEGYNEQSFIDAIIRCNGYTIEQGILSLTKDGRTMLTFRRHLPGQD